MNINVAPCAMQHTHTRTRNMHTLYWDAATVWSEQLISKEKRKKRDKRRRGQGLLRRAAGPYYTGRGKTERERERKREWRVTGAQKADV